MAFIENTGLERLWGHIVHRLSLKADKEDLNKIEKTISFDEIEILAEAGVADPVADENGQVLTDANNIIYIF